MIDFTQYKNIGPMINEYLNEKGYSEESFLNTSYQKIFLDIVSVIGPEKGLKGCSPRSYCLALIGAQKNLLFKEIDTEKKNEVDEFVRKLKGK